MFCFKIVSRNSYHVRKELYTVVRKQSLVGIEWELYWMVPCQQHAFSPIVFLCKTSFKGVSVNDFRELVHWVYCINNHTFEELYLRYIL